MQQHITPMLWYNNNAEEAAQFYTSIFKNSSIDHVARAPKGGPNPEGSVMVVSFTLNGQKFTALNGGPMFQFSEAISFVIGCKDQEEIDYYWGRLTADGGQESQCGWLKDKYGLSWQVTPANWGEMMVGGDPKKSANAFQAMMGMKKLDIATLEKAYAEG